MANKTVSDVWMNVIQHVHFLCKAHHTFLVLGTLDNTAALGLRTTLNSKTTKKMKQVKNIKPN